MLHPGAALGRAKLTLPFSSAQQDPLAGSIAPALWPTMVLPYPRLALCSTAGPNKGQIHHLLVFVGQALTSSSPRVPTSASPTWL